MINCKFVNIGLFRNLFLIKIWLWILEYIKISGFRIYWYFKFFILRDYLILWFKYFVINYKNIKLFLLI